MKIYTLFLYFVFVGIKAAIKQFSFMLTAVERRIEENMQLSADILEVEVKYLKCAFCRTVLTG